MLPPASTRPSESVMLPLIFTNSCRNTGSTMSTPSNGVSRPHDVRCQIDCIPSATREVSGYTAKSRISNDIFRGPHCSKIRCSSSVGSPAPYGMHSLFERKSPILILPLSVVTTPTEPIRPPDERSSEVVMAINAYVRAWPEPRKFGGIWNVPDS